MAAHVRLLAGRQAHGCSSCRYERRRKGPILRQHTATMATSVLLPCLSLLHFHIPTLFVPVMCSKASKCSGGSSLQAVPLPASHPPHPSPSHPLGSLSHSQAGEQQKGEEGLKMPSPSSHPSRGGMVCGLHFHNKAEAVLRWTQRVAPVSLRNAGGGRELGMGGANGPCSSISILLLPSQRYLFYL